MTDKQDLSNQDIITKLVDLDDKYEGYPMSSFETGFLETLVGYHNRKYYNLTAKQRETGIRILEKYDEL